MRSAAGPPHAAAGGPRPARGGRTCACALGTAALAVAVWAADPATSHATSAGGGPPWVRVGLDVVAAEAGGPLAGKRVGLVAHAASVGADGRHAVDVLRGTGVQVVRLFAPEHGLHGRAAAGEKLRDGVDAASSLPVVSLYGAKTRPSARDLAGLDALVFDLQDAGVRFYTYLSTLLLCLEAAAEAGVDLVVLDRPNPLGGLRIEGPVSDPPDVVPRSLVNLAPGPLVHGLTAGEMARLVNAAQSSPARLSVVPMQGWRRSMVWADTGRRFVPPSPNLRTPEAVLAYPGTCLLEATTASEGRGTGAPFLLLGAPGMDSGALSRVAVPGFALEPATFTPRGSEAAPRPKHAGRTCSGVRIRVKDARVASGYALGVSLLAALVRQPGFAWRAEDALDRLVGTRRVRLALEAGDAPEAILAADAAAIEAFRRGRVPALLY